MNKWEPTPVYLPLITDIGPPCSHTNTHTKTKKKSLFTPWLTSRHKVPNTQRGNTHWGKKQLVNNWRSWSATALSEGTACKHHRRKVKAPASNYLSPKAIAVETESVRGGGQLDEVASSSSRMRCRPQIRCYLSDCMIWWSRSAVGPTYR